MAVLSRIRGAKVNLVHWVTMKKLFAREEIFKPCLPIIAKQNYLCTRFLKQAGLAQR